MTILRSLHDGKKLTKLDFDFLARLAKNRHEELEAALVLFSKSKDVTKVMRSLGKIMDQEAPDWNVSGRNMARCLYSLEETHEMMKSNVTEVLKLTESKEIQQSLESILCFLNQNTVKMAVVKRSLYSAKKGPGGTRDPSSHKSTVSSRSSGLASSGRDAVSTSEVDVLEVKESRVGTEYQAIIPSVIYTNGPKTSYSFELKWDPVRIGSEEVVESFVKSVYPAQYGKNITNSQLEYAYDALHNSNYNVKEAAEYFKSQSDNFYDDHYMLRHWTDDEKIIFENAIMDNYRRDLRYVASRLPDKNIDEVVRYYYLLWKQCDGYKSWSSMWKDRRQRCETGEDQEVYHDDSCFHCHKGGKLMCCDTCVKVFHPDCVGLANFPSRGTWDCIYCRGRRETDMKLWDDRLANGPRKYSPDVTMPSSVVEVIDMV